MEEQHSPTTPSPSKPTTSETSPPPPSSNLHRVLLLLLLLAFLFLLPLLPSEFLHHTPLALTTSWELLHLLLVGIAISYGLCSRRTTTLADPDHHHKDTIPHKPHPSHLQVASVFDDEDDDGYSHHEGANNTHTWNSRCHRGEPTVVLDDRPLCLPIRSLRSQVPQADNLKTTDGFDDSGLVLPSPIPWRTRSGRLEAKVEPSSSSASPTPPSPVLEKAPSFRSRRPSPSPSSSRSHSPDQTGRSKEDGSTSMRLRRSLKSSSSSPVPPPPPPPPPRTFPASRRSLYPSETFLRRQLPSKARLDESNRSGGQEQEQSFPPPPPAQVPETKQLGAKAKPKRRNGSSRKFILESDDDRGSGSEGELSEEESSSDASSSVTEAEAEAEVNEVDKKADEFIAKFREQIRLQRIESIKRSAAQRKRSSK